MSKGTYDLLTEYDKVETGSKITDKKSGKQYLVLEQQGRKITLKDLSSGQEVPMSTSRFAITLGQCDVESPTDSDKDLPTEEQKHD